MKRIVTTAAFPFIPAELTLAHCASTYLPADIYHRFQNMFGNKSVLVSATDVHGVWVKREILKTGQDAATLTSGWHDSYQRKLSLLNITFDQYGRTDDTRLETMVTASLNRLREQGYMYEAPAEGYACNSCLEPLPRRLRANATSVTQTGKQKIPYTEQNLECGLCHSTDIIHTNAPHWFMDLPRGKSLVEEENALQQDSNQRGYIQSVLDGGLEPWDITREQYHGTVIPFGNGKQYLYLWYESLLGYAQLAESAGPNESASFVHFFGKNIMYYHGVVWPIILREGLGVTNDFQLSPRGFLNLAESDESVVNIEKAVTRFGADYMRFYLAFHTPDSISDYSFTEEEMKTAVNGVACNRIGSFFSRCRSILRKSGNESIEDTGTPYVRFAEAVEEVRDAIEEKKMRKALQGVCRYIDDANKIISEQQLYRNPTATQTDTLAQMMTGGLLLMKPFMPNRVQAFNLFGLPLHSFTDIQDIYNRKITYADTKWEPINATV